MMFWTILLVVLPTWAAAFHLVPLERTRALLQMAPKYVDGQWVPQTKDDTPEAGYDLFGTFVRHGPKPAITRVFQPKDYEQAILKFMAQDQCDYLTAQGNMDAYLRNPADWTYQRMEDTKRGIEKKRDYVTIRINEIVLVLVWSAIVFAIVGRVIYSVTNGVDFVRSFISISWVVCCFVTFCNIFLTRFIFAPWQMPISTIGVLVLSMEAIDPVRRSVEKGPTTKTYNLRLQQAAFH